MNSNFHLNSIRNFNSDFFHLVPSKFVTFGEGPGNNPSSEISENLSNNIENNIIFNQNSNEQSNKFKFDFYKSPINNMRNYSNSKVNSTIKEIKNKDKLNKNNDPIYFKYSLRNRSKTILNMINTCLLDLFIPSKKGIKTNINIQKQNNNINHLIELLNEDFISKAKDNDNNNQLRTNSFFENIKFSPIKEIPINNLENEIRVVPSIKNDTTIEIRNKKEVKIKSTYNPHNEIPIQGAFRAINNNYENPAKIETQYEPLQIIEGKDNYIPRTIPIINRISNISNVTNNYFFQYNNPTNILKKKTKRVKTINNNNSYNTPSNKKSKENNINFKTSKNEEVLYGLYQLNQISVNGISISKFPVVSMNEDDLEVYILSKMLNETDYFTIVGKYYINIPVLDEEKYNKPLYDKIFKKEKEKISNLYLIGDNLEENNPVKLIRNFYLQIKEKILNIQNNYLINNKKALASNIELCAELEKLIISCNAITNTVTDYKKSGLKRKLFLEQSDEDEKSEINDNNKEGKEDDNNDNKNSLKNETNDNILESNYSSSKKKKPKKKHFKTYLCEFCNKAYSNGQGLGGHMSRIHPNQSSKYKDKIRIRREREKKREKLLNIKRDLFKKYGYDYDTLIDSKKKAFVQQFLQEHNEEYRNIRKNTQKENNDENISENEDEEGKKDLNIFTTPLPVKFINVYKKKELEFKETINNNLSKQKTNEKTEFKTNINKNNENIKDNEIGMDK